MSDDMLWGGRFRSGPDRGMLDLTVSTSFDMELLPFDLAVTRAHARALEDAGFLESGSYAQVDRVCKEILEGWSDGSLAPEAEDEDVHSFVERNLTARLGDIGRSIHAGRSRNDLVATDFRLWCREASTGLMSEVDAAIAALCSVAESHLETVMAGYTHLQRAQPVTLAFHLVAHAVALLRDRHRLQRAADSANVSPLGAGALAGSTLGIDPSVAARELGFSGTFLNAMDAVSDRDFAAELLFACSTLGVHLSRLCEEIVLWTSSEFGFARLADEWSTGSSMMPQKRNPDLAELGRGRAGTLIGDLTSLLAVLKGLPLAYDRDLQEDKPIVFRAVATARRILIGARRSVESLEFDAGRMLEAASAPGLWATDVAEELVRAGVPFREAHKAAGNLVARLEETATSLSEAPDELLASCHPRLTSGARALADPWVMVRARTGRGGPAPARVREQIASLRDAISP